MDDVKLGNLTAALANIRPAVLQIAGVEGEHGSKNKKFVQRVADRNAKDAALMLTSRSDVLACLVQARKLKIVSAMHDVERSAGSPERLLRTPPHDTAPRELYKPRALDHLLPNVAQAPRTAAVVAPGLRQRQRRNGFK